MIQRRGRVEQDQRSDKDTHADHFAGTGMHCRHCDQDSASANGHDDADTVADGIGQFFAIVDPAGHIRIIASLPAGAVAPTHDLIVVLRYDDKLVAKREQFMMRIWVRISVVLLLLVLAACQTGRDAPDAGLQHDSAQAPVNAADAAVHNVDFDALASSLIEEMLDRSPEWAIYQGHYENAGEVTIPDAEQRDRQLAFIEHALGHLAQFDREQLPPEQRTDFDLLVNRFESMRWYQQEFRRWAWMPSAYNVAGPLSVLLNTEFAPVEERLELVMARLEHVPEYYAAARDSLGTPTLEHTDLAISQNRGTLSVLEDIAEAASEAELDEGARRTLDGRLDRAQAAIEEWVAWLETRLETLEDEGSARSFRIGESLYEQKFAFDIRAGFSAAELHRRALAEKERLHQEMDELTAELWPEYFPDEPLPQARLVRIGRLIDRLSEAHVAVEDFVDEIREQIPELAEFVREHDLLDQDPDKPLIVRETPEYMRGTGAIASVSAPGPFNPGADTYYNVTPLETYGPERAASYLREYNDWMLQILNIHEAIPGHYTQLLHANRSPSLVKSLFGNGAMVEGWAVYAERMMLEEGWGDHEPELWLMHGKWLLRVTFNAILDYEVHVLGMDRDEAVRLMREEAFQEKSEATQKWRRLTLSQVQLTSYYAGYSAIYDLRKRLKTELGDDFDLNSFHNEFLSYGSSPVNTIAELMTGE